eukprot:scaffold84_cov163-Amphora_coffeaeformis.AAC.15
MTRHSVFDRSARMGSVSCQRRWLLFLSFVMTQPICFNGFFILVKHPQQSRHRCYEWCHHASQFSMTATNTDEEKGDGTRHQDVLLDLLSPPSKCDVDRMSSTDLAYIGDVVYEMLVRSNKVWPPKRTSDLQQQVVRLVRAEYQSAMVAQLRGTNDAGPKFTLTQNEERVLNRGRNAGAKTNHRKSNPAAYQDATALEALIVYFIENGKNPPNSQPTLTTNVA